MCTIIAYDQVSSFMKKELTFFKNAHYEDLPQKELAIALKYLDKKLKYSDDSQFYGKCLIVQALTKQQLFEQAAKILRKLPDYPYFKDHMDVHLRCLQRHFHQSAQKLVVAPPNTQHITYDQTVNYTRSIDQSTISIPRKLN